MTAAAPFVFKRTFMQKLWYALFRLIGWRAEYYDPGTNKYICVVAPHTSNFDFFVGFIFSRAYPLPFPNFFAKESAFKGWIGKLGRKVGGIPVDRSRSSNFVEQVAAEFHKRNHMILAITPEGTRRRTEYWKSGFYHMAMAAGVPIVLASIDYSKRLIIFGKTLMPTGDIDADMVRIKAFYAGVVARHPERHGEIRMRPSSDEKPAGAETSGATS
ncbi:MAG: 1-acyl-sn-glycerol-3-phosphate acyltransferase [Caldilineaceae bacterium]|nr:1-acyl-sn-glycerol-3-phosphate acyltransferase [Caldilineaceae bacterium]MBP8292550.1 1-acyl-sn-glycerol-3-phosphate acyltransferase [Caldilineaceae bacterium]